MPDFVYTARDIQGQRVEGTLAAGNEREALAQLSARSLFPLQVVPQQASSGFVRGKRVKGQLMATTYNQLAQLLRSGVPLLRAIAVLRDQTSHPTLKEILADVHSRVEEGATLADAMTRHTRAFSEMAINMVRAGGEGGFLEDALDRVAQFTEEQEDLKSRTVGALIYPVMLLVVGTVIVTALIVFAVPRYGVMFDNLRARGELPLLTDALLAFSDYVRAWGLFVVAGLALAMLAMRSRLGTESGRYWRDRLKLRIPLLGPIFQSLAVARFCRVLGTLLRNGVPILRSLEISRDAAGNRVLSEAIAEASENVSSGESLAPPLASSGHFPRSIIEIISVAEESNTLDKVLIETADSLERQTVRRLDLMVRMIEPLMLLVLAGVVLCVVIALLLPVVRMSSSF